MTGSVKEQVWRKKRRNAEMVQTPPAAWSDLAERSFLNLNVLRIEDTRIANIRRRLSAHLWHPTSCVDYIDMLEPASLIHHHGVTAVDLNGAALSRVQRIFPDTLRCEVRVITHLGSEKRVHYYEIICGAVTWWPPSTENRERLLRWLPKRWHKWVAEPGLNEGRKKQFLMKCIEENHGSRQ